eukprot:4435202-Amphidinium_carterae.1
MENPQRGAQMDQHSTQGRGLPLVHDVIFNLILSSSFSLVETRIRGAGVESSVSSGIGSVSSMHINDSFASSSSSS